MTATVLYKGKLRCECTHLQSSSVFETDAPTDNHGKGEKFSPTDTLCVSLATCIVTTMALKAGTMNIELAGTSASVIKHMLNEPRRIGSIEVTLHFPAGIRCTDKERMILQKTGDNCPVAKSLHPDLEVKITYRWNEEMSAASTPVS